METNQDSQSTKTTTGISGAKLPDCCEIEGCERKPHTRFRKGIAVCNRHWQMLFKYGQPFAPQKPEPTYERCSHDGCENVANRVSHGLCETHYYRKRRTGSTSREMPSYRHMTSNGYVMLSGINHPLRRSNGYVSEHRYVAYSVYGPDCSDCFWCGAACTWKNCHVDHLNDIKDDNRPENLVIACASCNRIRGLAIPFLKRMKDERRQFFVDLMVFRKSQLSQ